MEQDFLSLYFGSNNELQAFAKKLLIANKKDAAKELNKAIIVLGSGANADQIIKQIEVEFRVESNVTSRNYANPDPAPALSWSALTIFIICLFALIASLAQLP